MRTTVTLDPDVQILLKEAAHRCGKPLKTTPNEAVRAGLLGKVRVAEALPARSGSEAAARVLGQSAPCHDLADKTAWPQICSQSL